MDLVPEVSILNQPTYRSNSNEIKKLQKKNERIDDKGVHKRKCEFMCSSNIISTKKE
jgi:hypothetical protein